MKKFFSVFAICCCMLISGFVFAACDNSPIKKISLVQDENNLVELAVKVGSENIEKNEDGNFYVDREANVRVEVLAAEFGVDFSEATIKLGDTERNLILNNKYDSLSQSGNKMYGYILLPKISRDEKLSVTGAKKMEATFTVEGRNMEDAETIKKLQAAHINLSATEENYVNLYTFLTGEGEKTYKRQFNITAGGDNLFSSLEIKFDAYNPYNLIDNVPFKIKAADGQEKTAASCVYKDDHFVVDLGEIGQEKAYTVIVDFKDLPEQEFNISKPEDNLTYKVSLESEVTSFSQEQTLTLEKVMLDGVANFDEVKVYVNSEELIKVGEEENKINYLFPKGITPQSTGGVSSYRVSVDGISYTKDSFTVIANSDEKNISPVHFIVPQVFAVNEEGESIGIIGIGKNGDQLTLQDQRNAVSWNYNFVSGYYRSIFELYNYDIVVNEQTLGNLQALLKENTKNFTEMKDLKIDLEGGYVLKAKLNDKTNKFDVFQLEFTATENVEVVFTNFVLAKKQLDVSYNFEDARIAGKVAIGVTVEGKSVEENAWIELEDKADVERLTITYGDVVCFRLATTRELIGDFEFKIEDQQVSNSWLIPERYAVDGVNYVVLKFNITDNYFEDVRELKLISATA